MEQEISFHRRLQGEISRETVGSVVSIRVRSCSDALSSLGFEETRQSNIKYHSDLLIAVESGHMVYENEEKLPSCLPNLCIIHDHEQRLIIRPKGMFLREFVPTYSGTLDIRDEIIYMIRRFIQEISDFGYSPHNLWASERYNEIIGIRIDGQGNFHFFLRDTGFMIKSQDPDDLPRFLEQVEMYLLQFFEL